MKLRIYINGRCRVTKRKLCFYQWQLVGYGTVGPAAPMQNRKWETLKV